MSVSFCNTELGRSHLVSKLWVLTPQNLIPGLGNDKKHKNGSMDASKNPQSIKKVKDDPSFNFKVWLYIQKELLKTKN